MSQMIKRTLLLAALLLVWAGPAHAQRVDFNGTWRLDMQRSEITTGDGLEGLGESAPETLYIVQSSGGRLVLSSHLPGSTPREYLIGAQSLVPAPRPSTRQVIMKSRTSGLTVTNEGTVEVDGEIVTVKEVLTMHPRGQLITVEVTTTRQWGPETNTLVYNRIAAKGGAPRP